MRDFSLQPAETGSSNTTLWRYFQTERLIASLTTSELYFAAATQFDDKFEGAVRVSPTRMLARYSGQAADFEDYFGNRRKFYKISCWHEADYENNTMWQLYATKGRGVAIRTTLARLRKAVKPYKLGQGPFNDILWCGRVRYIDFEKEHVPSNTTPPVGPLKRFFYKHRPFEAEREFRLVLDLGDRVGAIGDPRAPEGGVFVTFDLQELVEAIVIGPNLLESDLDQIRSAAISASLSDRIVESALRGKPRFL